MSRAISVKVATPKVIKALETKLATIKETYANQNELEAKYQETHKEWKDSLVKYAMDNFANATNIRTNYRSWNNSMNIDFDVATNGVNFPEEPVRDFEQLHSHTYKELVEDITNALSILRMTDEETVNATTMKQIAKYL